jgi:hypothetical protein
MRINVHIERLVLDGLPVSRLQGPMVRAAVEGELSRLLSAGGLSHEFQYGGAVPAVRGGNLRLSGDRHPGKLGQQIAGAVYGGIGNNDSIRSRSKR